MVNASVSIKLIFDQLTTNVTSIRGCASVWVPDAESEFRQKWDSTSEGRVTKRQDFPGSQMFMTIMTSSKKYVNIPVPALAIFAIPHVPDSWMTKSTDPAIHNAAEYYARRDLLAEKQAKAFEHGVRGARAIRSGGRHYIFLSNESDVLREMRSFLCNLK